MATIIAFPRATTPRRENIPSYDHLRALAQASAMKLRDSAVPNPHALADMLRNIAEELDRLTA